MKIIMLTIFLQISLAQAASRGEMVAVVDGQTLKVKDEKGKQVKLVLSCLGIKKLSKKQQLVAVEFLTYKTKGKVLIWDEGANPTVLINGVDNLALKALEWGISPLAATCTQESYLEAQRLGKQRKTGIWAP